MLHRVMFGVVLVAAGCKGEEPDTDTEVPVETDTEVPLPEYNFQGYLVRPDEVSSEGHLRISLLSIDPATFAINGELSSVPLSGTGVFQMFLPNTPSATSLKEAWPGHPGLKGGTWVPVVYDDADQSTTFTLGEGIVAVAIDHWLAYFDGTLPAGFPAAGWTEFTPDLTFATNEPLAFSALGLEAELVLRGTPSSTRVGGTFTGLPDDTNFITLVDRRLLTGEPEASAAPFANIDVKSGAFEVLISDRPATSQLYKDDPSGLWYAIAHPVVFDDKNGNGKFEDGTDVLSVLTACSDGAPIHLTHFLAPTTVQQAVFLDQSDGFGGWRMRTGAIGPDAALVPKAKTKTLRVEATCQLAL